MAFCNFKGLGFIICLLAFASCKDAEQQLEKKFFKFNLSAGLTSLDPAFAKDQNTIWASTQIFDGLVQVDKDLNVMPAIAKSWDISDDGLTYTFHLRNDVLFHENELFPKKTRSVTAQDFVYSFYRIVDPKVASPGRWIFTDRIAPIEPFTAIDDNTFQIKLKKPFRPMLGILSMPYCFVVPKEVVEHHGKGFRTNPVGTGPFKYKVWKENEVLVLEKNEYYFENELPKVDGVRISFFDTKKNEYMKFIEGELDFISGIDATFKDEVLEKDGTLKADLKDKFQLIKSPYMNTEYLGFNMEGSNSIVKNKKVRQAINYGFDREKMMAFLRNNVGAPATAGFIPKGLPSHNSNKVKGYTYNPQKARALLSEAGYPNGKSLPSIKLVTNPAYQDLCIYIQKQLGEIGIPVILEVNQSSFLRQMMVKGEVDFFRGSWIADYPDGESFLTVFYGGNPAPPNYTRFKNDAFDKLYEASLNENDNSKRYVLYQSMDKILIEEAPIVPLYYDQVMRFAQKNISGLEANAQNLLILKNVSIGK